MHRRIFVATSLALAALLAATAASPQTTAVRVRGTITAVQAETLAVKSRDGQDLRLALGPQVTVAAVRPLALADLRPGAYVGVTAVRGPDGALVAREVHTLPATAQEGHRPWDLEPGATMTNATIEAVVTGAANRELMLKYRDGAQTIRVPEGTPIVTAVPADRSALKPGEYVFVAAERAADGALTALRIQVSRDGVKPPQ